MVSSNASHHERCQVDTKITSAYFSSDGSNAFQTITTIVHEVSKDKSKVPDDFFLFHSPCFAYFTA